MPFEDQFSYVLKCIPPSSPRLPVPTDYLPLTRPYTRLIVEIKVIPKIFCSCFHVTPGTKAYGRFCQKTLPTRVSPFSLPRGTIDPQVFRTYSVETIRHCHFVAEPLFIRSFSSLLVHREANNKGVIRNHSQNLDIVIRRKKRQRRVHVFGDLYTVSGKPRAQLHG